MSYIHATGNFGDDAHAEAQPPSEDGGLARVVLRTGQFSSDLVLWLTPAMGARLVAAVNGALAMLPAQPLIEAPDVQPSPEDMERLRAMVFDNTTDQGSARQAGSIDGKDGHDAQPSGRAVPAHRPQFSAPPAGLLFVADDTFGGPAVWYAPQPGGRPYVLFAKSDHEVGTAVWRALTKHLPTTVSASESTPDSAL
jgi:hypothetical protein